MNFMDEHRIVTPKEARDILNYMADSGNFHRSLAYTVATEPERIAAAVEEERNRWRKMTQYQIDTERGFW